LKELKKSGNLNAENIRKYINTLIQLEFKLYAIEKIKEYTDIINNPNLQYLNELNNAEIKAMETKSKDKQKKF
jgi:hypothetical protein